MLMFRTYVLSFDCSYYIFKKNIDFGQYDEETMSSLLE